MKFAVAVAALLATTSALTIQDREPINLFQLAHHHQKYKLQDTMEKEAPSEKRVAIRGAARKAKRVVKRVA